MEKLWNRYLFISGICIFFVGTYPYANISNTLRGLYIFGGLFLPLFFIPEKKKELNEEKKEQTNQE